MESTLASQFAMAYVTTHILQYLKMLGKFPLMQKDLVWLNRAFSAMVAFGVSVGVHMLHSFVANPDGSHVLTLVIAIPAWPSLLEHVWDWMEQYVFQEVNFGLFIKGKGNGNGSPQIP